MVTTDPKREQMAKSRAARARWLVVAVLGAFGALELGLRAAGYQPRLSAVPDKHFGWVLLPNQHTVQDGREVWTNALGFYGEDVPEPAEGREGSLIAVLGSSFSVGPGVSMSDGWPAQLESLLAEGARDSPGQGPPRPLAEPIRVANFAISGYGSQQMRRVFDAYVADLKPDVLVVELNSGAPVPAFLPADPKSRLHRWLVRSAVYDAWTQYITRDRGARMAPAVGATAMAEQRRLYELYDDPLGESHRESWRAVEADLRHMASVQRQHGGRVIVLAAPMLSHWIAEPPVRPAQILGSFGFMTEEGAPTLVDVFDEWSPAIERWLASCERMGYTRDGVRSAMRSGALEELWSRDAPPYLVTDPVHWSAEGHLLMAEAIAKALRAERE